MNEVKIQKIAKKFDELQRNKYILGGLFFLLYFVSIIQFILVAFHFGPKISSPLFGNDEWITWVSLSIAFVAAAPNMFGLLLLSKRKKQSYLFFQIAFIFLIANDIMLGLWFDIARLSLISLFMLMQFLNWDKIHQKENVIESIKKEHLLLLVIFVIILGLAFGFFMENVMIKYNLIPQYTFSWIAYIDGTLFFVSLVGWFLLSKHIKEGYYFFIIVNILGAIMFGVNGIWSTAMSYILYQFIDVGGLFRWTSLYFKEKKNI